MFRWFWIMASPMSIISKGSTQTKKFKFCDQPIKCSFLKKESTTSKKMKYVTLLGWTLKHKKFGRSLPKNLIIRVVLDYVAFLHYFAWDE